MASEASIAIAFIVKSRLDKSSSSREVKRTESGAAVVAVSALDAVGCDLAGRAAIQYGDGAVADTRGHGALKQLCDGLGSRGGGHVPVVGAAMQQRVAHTAADQAGFVPGALQRIEDVDYIFWRLNRVHLVLELVLRRIMYYNL